MADVPDNWQPFWNASGKKEYFDPPPLHEKIWTRADGESALEDPERKALEGMPFLKEGCEVVEARVLASSVNVVSVPFVSSVAQSAYSTGRYPQTLLVRLADDQEYILRMTPLNKIARETISDPENASWPRRKFDAEIAIMQLLTSSSIPSPRVIASHIDEDQNLAYALFEKLPGLPVCNAWGIMEESAKVSSMSFLIFLLPPNNLWPY